VARDVVGRRLRFTIESDAEPDGGDGRARDVDG
jgi:hypothetical protein